MQRLFSMPLVDCISTARSPTADDLAIVSQRIWDEALAPCGLGDRGEARRMARIALCGTAADELAA